VGSRKRLGWRFELDELRRQPLLERDWLLPIEQRWPEALTPHDDVVGGGSQLWRLVYEAVAEQRRRVPEIIVVRHEELSSDPVGGFEELYGRLGLPFHARARQAVVDSTSADNPAVLDPSDRHGVHLDSISNLGSWRRRLSSDEADRVLDITRPLVDELYPDWPARSASPGARAR